MANHVKILGMLHIIFSSLGIVVAVGMLILFGGLAGVLGTTDKSEDAIVGVGVLGAIGAIVFMVILVLSLPGLIAGIGLIKFRPWARILGIVISALDLISVPFGTALGIYGLWVLLSNETEALFRNPNACLIDGPAGPVGPLGPVA
jgi:hypothetical protein